MVEQKYGSKYNHKYWYSLGQGLVAMELGLSYNPAAYQRRLEVTHQGWPQRTTVSDRIP